MPNVYWSKNAFAASGNESSAEDAREADESNTQTLNSDSASILAINTFRSSTRGGAVYRFARCYWAFDMSSYQGVTLSNLKFNYKPTTTTSTNSTDNYLIKTDAFGSNTNFQDYGSDQWFESLNYGVAYSSGFTFPDSTTAQQVSLNSNATSQISTNGFIQICMVMAADYTGLGPVSDVNITGYMNVGGNTSGNTFLSFDDTGYGNNVNGITASNIVKINDEASSGIVKVNDIS